MKLTGEGSRELLKIESKTTKGDNWIDYCISVGDSVGRIASVLHVTRGYEYLKSKGYDLKYANILLNHFYLNNDATCTQVMGQN